MSKNVDIVERYTLAKNKNGITLVALVVTLIILLILAGISIAQLTGNGLFEKAKLAKYKQANAQIKEEKILSEYANSIGNLENISSNRENDKSYFLKIYKNDVLCEDMPTKEEGYYPKEITCTNGATAQFDTNSWSLTISGITTKNVICTMKFIYIGTQEKSNLNQTNIKTFSADGSADGCLPEKAIDGSMTTGKGYNWYGGTKLLIEYNTLSIIENIGVYTTDNWGYSFPTATIYYSEDDSLTLESDLSQFETISVSTGSKQLLEKAISAKRVMIVKNHKNAVYEFQCFGYFSR